MSRLFNKATSILKKCYGNNANFRDGQFEAIESTYNNSKTLVVQKTGWGKSLVYFLTTKILRSEEKGLTLVISPLLVLMENQKEQARRLGLKSAVLNSTTKKEHKNILLGMKNDEYDVVFITPETLFTDEVQLELKNIKIGLFVIDEAHCISDWGHDFRLKFCKINKVIRLLPSSVHILATTATANNRVVDDLKSQLGDDVFISRGPLTRESLHINIINVTDIASRYAWIVKNINKLPGSGIIYCLTHKDCDGLATYLSNNGISALPYYSQESEEKNNDTIERFLNNKIKVVVATVKLGMGFDKGDIGFVIHYQMPSNIVSYYQQIGRAGRNIDKAYAILMHGKEDNDITDFFINNAFPTEYECNKVLFEISNSYGLSINNLQDKLNIRKNRLEKALDFLVNEEAIYKEKSKYYRTSKKYEYNKEHYDSITAIRKREKEEMNNIINEKGCLSKYIVNCLDDNIDEDCHKCCNCTNECLFDNNITKEELDNALEFLRSLSMKIEPRKQWPSKELFGTIKIEQPNESGLCLSKYGDAGYGKLVSEGKYKTLRFDDELVNISAKKLSDQLKDEGYNLITCVPSLRSQIVNDFTKRLAKLLNIEYIEPLYKTNAPQQKNMENSAYQCKNAIKSFHCDEKGSGKIILVDDIIDSKWTITVCGNLLRKAGYSHVFPFALADSSHNGDDDE